jgi:glycosyltransferase involved in cell wall biosynthesis
MVDLSIVIPSIDEERLKSTLFDYLNYYSAKNINFEILIVRNKRSNEFSEEFKELINKKKNVRMFYFETETGKGSAVLRGFEKAKGKLIGFVDEDDAVEASEFDKLVKLAKQNDCVIASRRMPESKLTKRSFVRATSSSLFNSFVNAVFGLGIKDTQCGAKVFDAHKLKKILPKIRSTGFEFDVELLWRFKKIGTIKEKGIRWEHKQNTSFSVFAGPKMALNLIKIKLSH